LRRRISRLHAEQRGGLQREKANACAPHSGQNGPNPPSSLFLQPGHTGRGYNKIIDTSNTQETRKPPIVQLNIDLGKSAPNKIEVNARPTQHIPKRTE
jgi:hypothetical protein